jgi:type I restriction enzyme R subunit
MKFTEAQLEAAFIELLGKEQFEHVDGRTIVRDAGEVLLLDDLRAFLRAHYKRQGITANEVEGIIRQLHQLPASDLYDTNKAFMKMLMEGFALKREDRSQKDLWVHLIDFSNPAQGNTFKVVNQLKIEGFEPRIPDAIVYINGLPLVVIEFKSAIVEEATVHDAFKQLTVRYRRDIPELFKYNAFCVISDGANNRAGSFFAPYEFFYSWRRVAGKAKDVDGIESLYTMIEGMFNRTRLCDIIHNFIYMPDSSKRNEKILCRYPQYYAARKLFESVKRHQRPQGDGKGGTYFGATGCGKSFTMLYLTRLIMKSEHFASPTVVMITDRTDLDDQLSTQFTEAKGFVGDSTIVSVRSRQHLRDELQGRKSGGVYLTTIHKFNEDIKLLSDRTNIICISDEAHRSQTNLDQKVRIAKKKDGTEEVKRTFGFAKYLHDSLPNATFVGFTGTPIDSTLDVFGEVVDVYTMTESVKDKITVGIVYEGRAAKVLLKAEELRKIEKYYEQCAVEGANEHQIEESKKATAQMNAILGDPDRLKAVAKDFIQHYEQRIEEGATLYGKAMFVCSSREIAYDLYKLILNLRPEWKEVKAAADGAELTEDEKKKIKPMERIKLVMTRNKDDVKEFYNLIGDKKSQKELDRQFKNAKSNFKIAILVDMWLTGFDVPFLDTMYIDKPIEQHNLIQTISRVNRKFEGKEKGLVVDYIGIKKQMNKALKKYSKGEERNFEEIEKSITVVRNQLELLANLFHKFDAAPYFTGKPLLQLECLNKGAEFVLLTKQQETRFVNITKRMKAAYDICCGSEVFSQSERDHVHFYLAIRSIVVKLTKGDAPDTAQMNAKVNQMIKDALESQGVEEVLKIGEEANQQDIFSDDYLAKIEKIKLPHTKFQLLQQLLKKAIDQLKQTNMAQGINFTQKMTELVNRYNDRKGDILVSEVLEEFTDEIIDLINELRKERDSFKDMGIDFEEKAFYDILRMLATKYDFEYPDEKLIPLAQEVKKVVDDKAAYTDWNHRDDIKAELKADLIILLHTHGYPPVDKDEVYKEIFAQAENFKKNRKS